MFLSAFFLEKRDSLATASLYDAPTFARSITNVEFVALRRSAS